MDLKQLIGYCSPMTLAAMIVDLEEARDTVKHGAAWEHPGHSYWSDADEQTLQLLQTQLVALVGEADARELTLRAER